MKKLRYLLAVATGLMLALPPSFAESPYQGEDDYEPAPYFFVGVQGGAQVTMTNYDFSKLLMPVGAISVGGYYNPVVGGRLHLMGFRDKGGFNSIDRTYYYDYYTADADLLLNLTNLFWKGSPSHLFNLVLIGGVGLNYAWHNNEVNNLITANSVQGTCPEAWAHNRLGHNLRVGLQLDVNVSKHFGINLEGQFNNMDDRFNSKKANSDDWQAVAMLGVQYKFGYKAKKFKAAPAPAPVPVRETVPAPKPTPTPAPKPEPAAKPAPAPVVKSLKENIFYDIRSSIVPKSELNKVSNIAKFMKENPNATVEVIGYADVKTGNPTINMKYSKKRAMDLKNKLVKEYGISSNRISVDAKGDTVQPFDENAKNRVSIITGSTK